MSMQDKIQPTTYSAQLVQAEAYTGIVDVGVMGIEGLEKVGVKEIDELEFEYTVVDEFNADAVEVALT